MPYRDHILMEELARTGGAGTCCCRRCYGAPKPSVWKAGGCIIGPEVVAGGGVTLGQCNGTGELFKRQVNPVLS